VSDGEALGVGSEAVALGVEDGAGVDVEALGVADGAGADVEVVGFGVDDLVGLGAGDVFVDFGEEADEDGAADLLAVDGAVVA
jgi:hypothetical protein